MFQKNGNLFRRPPSGRPPKFDYAEVIRVALKSELGSDPQSVQIVSNWTGATERTVNNWLNGVTGPSGLYLIRLLRKSDAVLETVLSLAARNEMLERYYETRRERSSTPIGQNVGFPPKTGRKHAGVDPDRDPDDPEIDLNVTDLVGPRQIWFLQELRRKPKATAKDICQFFGVSQKTAKRDVAALKQLGIIGYEGSHRKGRYVALSPSR